MSNEQLALRVRGGDPAALERLWERVKDYAHSVVKHYASKPYAETEDYLQTAFLGVHAAAMAFNPERGSFLTVADWYIRRACSQFYCWHRRGEVETISYDVPMNADDPDGGDFRDSFPDESLPDPLEGMEASDKVRDVRAAVDDLKPRQREIIDQKYYQNMPLEAVCRLHGVSAERIRQIENDALKQLRDSKHLVCYQRDYAPIKGVGVSAFRVYGGSAVEHVAIKNVDRQRKAELRAFVKHVKESVDQGYYSPEIGQMVIENYKAQHGMP